jgi:hypothetical protein
VSTGSDDHTLRVDGEEFRVHTTEDGTTHCDWLTGPNPGYGLSIGRPATFGPEGETPPPAETELADELLVQSIRDFLAGINPETGYLD